MRIAITGAQSTGKSTLLRYLKKDVDLKGFEFIDELTRKIAAKGININEEGSNLSQIFTVTIHAENIIKDHFISDRCTLDGLVYTHWLYENKKVDKWMLDYALNVAKEILPRYDYIFYLPPEIPIEDDGIRSADVTFRDEIVKLFDHYIKELGINVIELTGSVADRAKKFRKILSPRLVSTVSFTDAESLTDLVSSDEETNKYLTDAYQYWVSNGYHVNKSNRIIVGTKGTNIGWAFVRIDDDGNCHLSRFTVEEKGDGLGSAIFQQLKREYKQITLWSNPEAEFFYAGHGVTFTKDTTEVNKKIYTFGYYERS